MSQPFSWSNTDFSAQSVRMADFAVGAEMVFEKFIEKKFGAPPSSSVERVCSTKGNQVWSFVIIHFLENDWRQKWR